MSRRDKLRQKLRNNPTQATMHEVETLLLRFGFTLARVSGSHHIYEYENDDIWRQIVVPLHGRKVKKVYVQKAIALIDELFPEDRDLNDE